MKKLITLVLVVVLVSSVFVGCSKPAETTEIGIVLPTKEEPRWVQDEKRFNTLLDTSDYNAEILFSQGDPAKEKQNVETLLSKGIEVLIITPQDGKTAGAAVESAKEEGVTVISYDRLVTDTKAVDYYATFNSVSVGEAQAQYLIDNLDGETGQDLYLYAGAATDNNAFLFFEGAWNKLQPKIADGTFVVQNSSKAIEYKDKAKLSRSEMGEIIEQITTDWKPEVAKSKAESHITSAPPEGKTFILAPNDGTARTIYDEFSNEEGTEILITGQDAEKPSIQYIIDGKQSMTVLKDVRDLVKGSFGMAIDVLDGNEIETTGSYDNGVIDVPAMDIKVKTVTQDNVKEVIIDSGYYDASEFTGVE